jgi:poly-gamma-glutamate synthesis protein (capsule biosynthesis protein)
MKPSTLLLITLLMPLLASADNLHLVAVGDVLLHKKLQRHGMQQSFSALWKSASPYLQQADIAYANLEGPIARNITQRGLEASPTTSVGKIYTSFPMFNYPPKLATDLQRSGFDIVSTANNHSLDRYGIGVEKTINILNEHKIHYVGSRKSELEAGFSRFITQNGFRSLWIACTQDTNGIEDKKNQVLFCHKKAHANFILKTIKDYKDKVDFIVVTPHWGVQYQLKPNKTQKTLAKKWLEAGATLIIGNHPHVLQPIRFYTTQDKRKTLIAYSLGNFVSNQGSLNNRLSGLLSVSFVKEKRQTIISKVSFLPTIMQNRHGKLSLKLINKNQKRLLNKVRKQLDKGVLLQPS